MRAKEGGNAIVCIQLMKQHNHPLHTVSIETEVSRHVQSVTRRE
jgi:hypothetical protein